LDSTFETTLQDSRSSRMKQGGRHLGHNPSRTRPGR
jgi:hypothetical protein